MGTNPWKTGKADGIPERGQKMVFGLWTREGSKAGRAVFPRPKPRPGSDAEFEWSDASCRRRNEAAIQTRYAAWFAREWNET